MNEKSYHEFTSALLASVAADARVQALIAVGSMAETGRKPDAWSDHDFFLIVQPDTEEQFRESLGWLPDAPRIILSIRETEHGLKVLYDTPHMIEFAVFSPQDLRFAKVNDYRVLLDRADITARMQSQSVQGPQPNTKPQRDFDMVMALLYVGAGRYARGEELSAHLFIRHHVLQHLLPWLIHLNAATAPQLDNLDPFRRLEQILPDIAAQLSAALSQPLPACGEALFNLALKQARLHQWPVADSVSSVIRDYLRSTMPR